MAVVHIDLTAWHPPKGGRAYDRIAVRTPWLGPGDDLLASLLAYLPRLRRGDTVVISEKVAVLLAGRAVPADSVRPGRLARFLAGRVRCRTDSRGLSVPLKMQYVLDTVGRPRLLLAAVAGGATRLAGRQGDFYRIAGPFARDLDGCRPPYEDLLLPPLPVSEARRLCLHLEGMLGVGVALVDINDFGGTIRATSERSMPPDLLLRVMSDNPLGQRLASTPFGVVRRHASAASLTQVRDDLAKKPDVRAAEGDKDEPVGAEDGSPDQSAVA